MAGATATRNGRGPRVPLMRELPTPTPEPEAAVVIAGPAPTPNLDAAVLRVQAEVAKLVRNAQGQIQNRSYSYVTLTAVNDEVLPLRVAEGLVWEDVADRAALGGARAALPDDARRVRRVR